MTSVSAGEIPSITLNWDAPTDTGDGGTTLSILRYVVEMAEDAEFSTGLVSKRQANDVFTYSTEADSLVLGTTYYARVRADNILTQREDDLQGDSTETLSKQAATLPGAPQSVNVSVSGALQFVLEWSEPLDKGLGLGVSFSLSSYAYVIYSAIDADKDAGDIHDGLQPSTTMTLLDGDLGFVAGDVYYMSVRADNEIGEGAWFSYILDCGDSTRVPHTTATCGITAVQSPSAPGGVTLGVTNNATLEIAFERPFNTGTGDDSYALVRYEVQLWSDPSEVVLTDLEEGTRNASFGGLFQGVYYQARVRAVSYAGNGTWSASATSIVLFVPTAPVDLALAWHNASSTEVSFSYSFSRPIDTGTGDSSWPLMTFNIDFAPNGQTNPVGETCLPVDQVINGSLTSGTADGLTKGCTYDVSISAANKAGSGPWSGIVSKLAVGHASRPTSVNVTATFSGQLDIEWVIPVDTGAYDADAGLLFNYRVDAALSEDFSSLVRSRSVSASENTVSLYFLDDGVRVYIRVAAESEAGLGISRTNLAHCELSWRYLANLSCQMT